MNRFLVQIDSFTVEKNEISNKKPYDDPLTYFAPTGTYKLDNKTVVKIDLYPAPDNIHSTRNISFHFDKKGITILQEKSENHSCCGFGHAFVANGFYKRPLSKMPILTEPLTGEKLEK